MFLSANNILHNFNIICNDVEIYIRIMVSRQYFRQKRCAGCQGFKNCKKQSPWRSASARAPFSVLVVVDVKMPVPAVFVLMIIFIDKIGFFQKLQVVH